MFFLSTSRCFPLYTEATGEPAGGGTGATGEPPVGTPDAPPAPLTLEAIMAALETKLPNLVKTSVAEQVNGALARIERQQQQRTTTPAATTTPAPTTQGADPFKPDREKELSDRLAALEAARDQERKSAQEKETDAEIKTALSDFQWSTDAEGKSIAFDFYRSKAARDDDGNLVIGQMPLATYIKEHASRNFKNYFSTRGIGGAGTPGGRAGASSSGATIDKIKPGMSAADDAAARDSILSAVSALRANRS